jgi:hypothetical protein
MSTDESQVVGGCCFRLRITWSHGHMVTCHVPSAAEYPRRGAGRKGAYGVAMRWRKRHPCPRHHDEHSGQDQGNGAGAGSESADEGQEVRAPCAPYRADTHGLSRLVTVTRNCCSRVLSCPCHVVPKLTAFSRMRQARSPSVSGLSRNV